MVLREGVIIGECAFLTYMFMGGVPFNCSQIVKMKLIITTIFVWFLLSHTPFRVMFAYNLKVLNMFHALFVLF